MSSTQLDHPTSRMSWADSLPPGWSVQRLRNLAYLSNSNVDKKTYEDGHTVRLCNYTDVYYNEFITDDMEFMSATATPAEIRRFALQLGDVIITKDSESWNDIAVPACVTEKLNNVVCGYHLTLIRPIPDKIDGRFLLRAFQAQGVREQFWLASNGVTRFGLGQQGMKDALIPVPPIGTQRAIADFLDRKTAAIDALIQNKEKLIELLEEKRDALINQAVTKGLDPNVPMKDSGIPWIGEIPAHWESLPLKYVCRIIDGDRGVEYPNETDLVPEGIPFLSSKNLVNGELTWQNVRFISFEKFARLGRGKLNDQDLLVTVRGTIGSIGRFVSDEFPTGFINAQMMIVRPSHIDSAQLWYQLRSLHWQTQVGIAAYGAAQQQLSNEVLRNTTILTAARGEQRQIAEHLQVLETKFSALLEKLKAQLDLIHEYRQSIIMGAVTGQINIEAPRKEHDKSPN